jgi:hypothetical protein
MPERCHRDDDAGYVIRRLQRVCPTQGVADAFAERIHPPFSNRRVSGLIGATPHSPSAILELHNKVARSCHSDCEWPRAKFDDLTCELCRRLGVEAGLTDGNNLWKTTC